MWRARQSAPRRRASMSRLALALLLLTVHHSRATYVTPSLSDRLDRLYAKIELLNSEDTNTIQKPQEKLYQKLEKLNALTPDRGELTEDDEELLQTIQLWGKMNPDQMDGVVRDLQSVRDEEFRKSDKVMESDDSDGEWSDNMDQPEGDYPADFYADEEPNSASTTRPGVITPSTMTRLRTQFRDTTVSAADYIAATNERPTIVHDTHLTAQERKELRRAAFANIAAVLKSVKCLEPQPRWFTVRHLAPAANIVYMPPCVQLHRCAPDSGCCYDETEVCAPVRGDHVEIPFYLKKTDGTRSTARMRFFNHTHCACVSRSTLQTTVRSKIEVDEVPKKKSRDSSEEARQRQNDWRGSTEEPSVERGDDHTAPPQLRRCTCPTLFFAQPLNEGICSCVCEWPDPSQKRDCLSLARGREHFGMRDRVCVDNGDCNPPACEYGPYEKTTGRCPRRVHRIKYYHRRVENTSD